MILKGKIAVVTGASDGIGREIALKLAGEKVSLALIGRNEERLNQVLSECIKLGSPKVVTYPIDLKNKNQIKDGVEKINKDFSEVDILINNAGVWQKVGQLDDVSLDDIESVIGTNLMGLVMMTNQMLPKLRNRKEAAIVNVSSHSGIESKQGQSVYCASKWGVTGFTETLRLDLKGTNIRIAGLYQGGTHTGLLQKANDPRDPEIFEKFSDPSDLADVVIFILSRPPKIWLHDVRVEY